MKGKKMVMLFKWNEIKAKLPSLVIFNAYKVQVWQQGAVLNVRSGSSECTNLLVSLAIICVNASVLKEKHQPDKWTH